MSGPWCVRCGYSFAPPLPTDGSERHRRHSCLTFHAFQAIGVAPAAFSPCQLVGVSAASIRAPLRLVGTSQIHATEPGRLRVLLDSPESLGIGHDPPPVLSKGPPLRPPGIRSRLRFCPLCRPLSLLSGQPYGQQVPDLAPVGSLRHRTETTLRAVGDEIRVQRLTSLA